MDLGGRAFKGPGVRVLPGKGRGSRNKGRKSLVCEPMATWEPALPQASAQGQDPGDHKSEYRIWGAGMDPKSQEFGLMRKP